MIGKKSEQPSDEVVKAADELERVLESTQAWIDQSRKRIQELRQQRQAGKSYSDIVSGTDQPLLVQLLSYSLAELQRSGHRLRQAQARALYEEGLTLKRIARLFGVSHQRISYLIRGRSQKSV